MSGLARFWRDQGAAAAVETLMVFPLFVVVLAGFFELAVFYWQISMLNSGLAQVTRAVALMPPGASDFATALNGFVAANGATPVTLTCGSGTAACSADVAKRMLTGSDTGCDALGTRMGLCDFLHDLTAQNLRLTYVIREYVAGPHPIARVQVQLDVLGYHARLPVLGSLFGFASVDVAVPPGQAIMEYSQ